MRIGAWFAVPCALAVVRCGDDDAGRSGDGSLAQGGSTGGTSIGPAGAPSAAGEGGSPEPGGSGGSSARGGSTTRGGATSRGGSSGRAPTGGVSGEAGSNVGGQPASGGADSGTAGESAGGTHAGGEGGAAGENGTGGDPGCQDPPSTELCSGDLSGVGTGDFEVKFTIRASGGMGWYAVLGQRDVCEHANFWSARLLEGALYFELDDGGPTYAACWSWIRLNDLGVHRVVVRRTSGELSIVVDCGTPELCSPASTPLSENLPPLRNATNDPCIASGTQALSGTVTDRCVRAL